MLSMPKKDRRKPRQEREEEGERREEETAKPGDDSDPTECARDVIL